MLDGSGSGCRPVTWAMLVIVPRVMGFTTMVTVALAPALSVPRSQVTVVPACAQLPVVDVTERKRTPDGRRSVRLAGSAEVPLFVTTMV